MSTKSVHAKWASRFEELNVWLETHGRMPRTTSAASDHERQLSAWISDQRNRHLSGLLPDRYVEALRGIEGILDARPLTPRQEELKDWVALHRRRPYARSADPVEAALGVLVYSLRSYALRGRLKLGTIELLLSVPDGLSEDETGLALSLVSAKLAAKRSKVAELAANVDPLEAKWNRGFDDLGKWFQEHGSLPNRRSKEVVQYRLANWLNVQRMQVRKGNLLSEHESRLRSIPGALEPRPRSSDDLVLARGVAAFHAGQGRLPRYQGASNAERLTAKHLTRLRTKVLDGTIGQEVREVLTAVPGAIEGITVRKTPPERLAELRAYIRSNGTFPLPKSSGQRGLAEWAYRALNGKGSPSPAEAERIRKAVQKLRGSSYVPRQSTPAYLDDLEAYVATHDHLPSSHQAARPYMQRARLQASLDAPGTDAFTRKRIELILTAKPWPSGVRRAA
jgi:hypothetical protein